MELLFYISFKFGKKKKKMSVFGLIVEMVKIWGWKKFDKKIQTIQQIWRRGNNDKIKMKKKKSAALSETPRQHRWQLRSEPRHHVFLPLPSAAWRGTSWFTLHQLNLTSAFLLLEVSAAASTARRWCCRCSNWYEFSCAELHWHFISIWHGVETLSGGKRHTLQKQSRPIRARHRCIYPTTGTAEVSVCLMKAV